LVPCAAFRVVDDFVADGIADAGRRIRGDLLVAVPLSN
jgi:hypothetical protein